MDEMKIWVSVIGGVVTFIWGYYQWRERSIENLKARRLAITKPFLEKQLELYSEATRVASQVAMKLGKEGDEARARFWELYWGELALVENPEVENAMVEMSEALESGAPVTTLRSKSLRIAHACRQSLDKSWGINAWRTGPPSRADTRARRTTSASSTTSPASSYRTAQWAPPCPVDRCRHRQ
jgi:hypothetical protein